MLRNEYGRFVQHHELYPLLDLKRGAHLPDEGFMKSLRVGLRVVTYKCEPIGVPGQRVKFACDCGRWIPFGRAGQHLRACSAYRAEETRLYHDPIYKFTANA